MYVHSDKIPDRNLHYLTPGKKYPLVRATEDGDAGEFLDDDGDLRFVFFETSAHLDGAAWTVTHD